MAKSNHTCLVCGRSLSTKFMEVYGPRGVYASYCIHESCTTDALQDWLVSKGFILEGRLVIYNTKRFQAVMKSPALARLFNGSFRPSRNEIAFQRYTPEQIKFYSSGKWRKIRERICRGWHGHCVMCGRRPNDSEPDCHHISGDCFDNRWVNILPLCRRHHRYIHQRVPYNAVPRFICSVLKKHGPQLPEWAVRRMLDHWEGMTMLGHEAMGKLQSRKATPEDVLNILI